MSFIGQCPVSKSSLLAQDQRHSKMRSMRLLRLGSQCRGNTLRYWIDYWASNYYAVVIGYEAKVQVQMLCLNLRIVKCDNM